MANKEETQQRMDLAVQDLIRTAETLDLDLTGIVLIAETDTGQTLSYMGKRMSQRQWNACLQELIEDEEDWIDQTTGAPIPVSEA